MSGQRPDRAERREFFIDVAGHLVTDEGLAAVTMERIAALAEVSKPVLYSHFADRGSLLTALLERCWRELDIAVQARLRASRTLEDSLEGLVAGYFDELDRQGCVLQLMVTSGWHEPQVEAARRARHRAAEASWSSFYQQRMGLSVSVADAAAAILRSALQGAASYRIEHPERDRKEITATCLTIMRAGLERLRRDARLRPVSPSATASRRRRSPVR